MTLDALGSCSTVHRGATLSRCFFRGFLIIMPGSDDKFYLHVTEAGSEQRPFSAMTLDQLQALVDDRAVIVMTILRRRRTVTVTSFYLWEGLWDHNISQAVV